MNLGETIITAFLALKNNLVRTFLTMLGIIIGVFSVVLLVSLVRGVQNYVTDQFNSLGSNLIFISPGRVGLAAQDPATTFTDNKLSLDHVKALASQDYTQAVTPFLSTGKTVTYKTNKYFSVISGVYDTYSEVFNIELSSGRFIEKTDDVGVKKVAVLGSSVAKKLFKDNLEYILMFIIKHLTKDFIVEEELKLKFEEGNYSYYLLKKENLTTQKALEII